MWRLSLGNLEDMQIIATKQDNYLGFVENFLETVAAVFQSTTF